MSTAAAAAVAHVEAAPPRTTVAMLGTIRSIATTDARRAARIRQLLAPFVVPDRTGAAAGGAADLALIDRGADGVVLQRGGVEVTRGRWPEVEARLLVELNAAAIGAYRGFAVHAGVVARGDRAVCFPGESGRGKSTMTTACLQAGFDYVSDEALCIERASRLVEPYPRPIALSPASVALLGLPAIDGHAVGDPMGDHARAHEREVVVLPSSIGARTVEPGRRLQLAHVIELRRGASEAHLEPLHRAHAVPALLSMSFNHFKEPGSSVEVVGELAREVRVWRLHHDDPGEAAALLARSLP